MFRTRTARSRRSKRAQSLAALSDLRPLGQIHDSFIVAAGRDGLWIIDQHVAHERILFEKVLRQQAEGRVESQHLLMPILLRTERRAADRIRAHRGRTGALGLRDRAVRHAHHRGEGRARPASAPPISRNWCSRFSEIAEGEMRKASIGDLRRAMAASIACRAAIKINMRLDQTKMEWLLNRTRRHRLPHELPARPAHRAALLHA